MDINFSRKYFEDFKNMLSNYILRQDVVLMLASLWAYWIITPGSKLFYWIFVALAYSYNHRAIAVEKIQHDIVRLPRLQLSRRRWLGDVILQSSVFVGCRSRHRSADPNTKEVIAKQCQIDNNNDIGPLNYTTMLCE